MRSSFRALLLAAMMPAGLLAQPAPSQAGAPAAPSLPPTAIGRIGQALLDAVNGADSVALSRFVAAHLDRDVRGRSPAAMTGMLVRLRAQSGGLRLERVRMAGSALRIMTQASNGRRWLGIELEPAPDDSTRASLALYPMDDPGIRRPPAPWSTETLTDERIATLVRERVRAAADSDRFSGVVLVAHGDSILVHEAYGYADRGTGRPVTLDTPFGVASLGKMFTGVAIAQLVAGGRLRLDDTLARVLPTYPNREAAERVTVRQLLSHTAGLPEPFLSPRFDPGHDYGTHEKLLATFADAPLAASAGQFAYSNGNYAALAAVVERLSGMSYDEYLRRNVWPPAKDRARAAAPAVGYAQFTELDPLGLEARRPETVRSRRPCPRPLGFGCGSYTADALFRFARALRTGTLVPAALVDTMTTGRVGMGGPMKYGYGFYEQRMHGVRVVGHSGSNPDTGHDADLQMVWEGDWTVIVLSNYDAPAGMQLEMQILDLLARQAAARRGGS